LVVIFSFLFWMSACNESSSEVNIEEPQSQEDKIKENNGDDSSDSESDYGDFEKVKYAQDIGSFQSGPISLELREVMTVSGSFNDQYYIDQIGKKDVEYIQIGMMISMSEENINFDSHHFTLTTDTDEELDDPNESFGTKIEPKYLSKDGTFRIMFYFLEDSKAEDIDEITMHVKAPTDSEGNPLGDDIKANIELKRSKE
jgi:hypothetical protein